MDNPATEHALRTATAVINLYRRLKITMERAAGMNLTSFQLLKSVAKHPGYSNRQHIEACRFCESVNTSYNFKTLLERGLIEIIQPLTSADRRAVYYSLTGKGKETLAAVDARVSDIVTRQLWGDDVEVLWHLLSTGPVAKPNK